MACLVRVVIISGWRLVNWNVQSSSVVATKHGNNFLLFVHKLPWLAASGD